MSKNTFDIKGDRATISHPDWDFVAIASIKDDYAEELQSVTWSKSGRYLYSSKLKELLHIYIMKKWYGEDVYEKMTAAGCVVDHMDNDGHNCCIDNLWFLVEDENKAKGFTVDKSGADKRYIALSMYKDFETQLFQITIVFNYPARLVNIEGQNRNAVVEIAFLLYDCDYEMVINDARAILYDYYYGGYSFDPNRLHFIDYDIEGTFGTVWPIEAYDEYLKGKHGHVVGGFAKKAPLQGWGKNSKKEILYLRELPA